MSEMPPDQGGCRLDSTLYFVAKELLPASEGFMPMIQFTQTPGRLEWQPMIDKGYFDAGTIEGALALHELQRNCSSWGCSLLQLSVGVLILTTVAGVPALKAFNEYNAEESSLYWQCRTLRLFRGRSNSGCLVPLTLVQVDQPVTFFTAEHATRGAGFFGSLLECSATVYAKYTLLYKVSKTFCGQPGVQLGPMRAVSVSCRAVSTMRRKTWPSSRCWKQTSPPAWTESL